MGYDESHFLKQCPPVFEYRLTTILAELRHLGWKPRIYSVRRTEAEQAQKVKEGVSKIMHSWHVDSTRALVSFHGEVWEVYGNAADIADQRYGWDGLASNTNFQFWKDLGRIAKKYGCEWGR